MADKHPAKVSQRCGRDADPGLKRLCKPFLTKEKPVLMKKEAVLTCFAPIPERSLFLSYD